MVTNDFPAKIITLLDSNVRVKVGVNHVEG
jgi:hypothetical protein